MRILFARFKRFLFLITRNPFKPWNAVDSWYAGKVSFIAAERNREVKVFYQDTKDAKAMYYKMRGLSDERRRLYKEIQDLIDKEPYTVAELTEENKCD